MRGPALRSPAGRKPLRPWSPARSNRRCFLSSLLLLACILCGTSSAFAQGTNLGTIRGRVTDPNGAAVKGAAVQVTDLETNISRDLTTDEDGEHEGTALKSGTYKVTVTMTGFATKAIRAAVARSEERRAGQEC